MPTVCSVLLLLFSYNKVNSDNTTFPWIRIASHASLKLHKNRMTEIASHRWKVSIYIRAVIHSKIFSHSWIDISMVLWGVFRSTCPIVYRLEKMGISCFNHFQNFALVMFWTFSANMFGWLQLIVWRACRWRVFQSCFWVSCGKKRNVSFICTFSSGEL